MTRPDKTTDPGDPVERAAVKHEARLEAAEDRLEQAAQKAEESFYEHTAKQEARLEAAEDRLEQAAHRAEESFYERGAKP